MLAFPGLTTEQLPAVRGTIAANGSTFALGSVTYTDTDGDGAVSSSEALAQLNAAAKASGVTDDDAAFVATRLVSLSENEYAARGEGVLFRGTVPADGASPAELADLTPVFTADPDPISLIDAALDAVSTQRAQLGALQNRFEHTIARLGVATENAAASLSRIRDTDMAQETTTLTRNQVLLQAGTAMLAQANQSASGVLTLLRS